MNAHFTQSAVSIKIGDRVEHHYKITTNNFQGTTGTTEGNISHVVIAVDQLEDLGGDISYNAEHMIIHQDGNITMINVSHSIYKISTGNFLPNGSGANELNIYEKQNLLNLLISFCDTMLTTGEGLIANDGDVLRFEFDYIIVYKISVYFRAWWDNDGKLIICELNVENELGYGIKYEIGEDPPNVMLIIGIIAASGTVIMFIVVLIKDIKRFRR